MGRLRRRLPGAFSGAPRPRFSAACRIDCDRRRARCSRRRSLIGCRLPGGSCAEIGIGRRAAARTMSRAAVPVYRVRLFVVETRLPASSCSRRVQRDFHMACSMPVRRFSSRCGPVRRRPGRNRRAAGGRRRRSPFAASQVASRGCLEIGRRARWRADRRPDFLCLDVAGVVGGSRATGHPLGFLRAGDRVLIRYLTTTVPVTAGLGCPRCRARRVAGASTACPLRPRWAPCSCVAGSRLWLPAPAGSPRGSRPWPPRSSPRRSHSPCFGASSPSGR